jgi:hypothetical protein
MKENDVMKYIKFNPINFIGNVLLPYPPRTFCIGQGIPLDSFSSQLDLCQPLNPFHNKMGHRSKDT